MELQPLHDVHLLNNGDEDHENVRDDDNEHEPLIITTPTPSPSFIKKTVQIQEDNTTNEKKKKSPRYSKRQFKRYTSLPSLDFKYKDDSETKDDDPYAATAVLVGHATADEELGMTPSQLEARHQSHHVLLLRQPYVSLEQLNPDPECRSRKSSTLIAMINLVATVCGGGVLSLPLCFRRAGILPTTLLMLYGAITTDFTLYLLVACARRTGGRSYGCVAMAAFGKPAQVMTTITLAIMLCGTLIAYQVLVKQIWSPVIYAVVPQLREWLLKINNNNEPSADSCLLLCILILGFPLLLKKDLHALRHTCYVGFSSCVLLMIAVVYRASQKLTNTGTGTATTTDYDDEEDHLHQQQEQEPFKINWYSNDIQDIVFAFPIVVLAFFCSFNVLSVHSQLQQPTRRRIRFVLDWSITTCFTLFFTVGLCGYLYAGDETLDNILLNFSIDDKAILAGRSGYCLTLLFGLPLVLLPCREAIVSIPTQIHDWRIDHQLVQKYRRIAQDRDEEEKPGGGEEHEHLIVNGVDFDESKPMLLLTREDLKHRHGHYGTHQHCRDEAAAAAAVAVGGDGPVSPQAAGGETIATTPTGSEDLDLENIHHRVVSCDDEEDDEDSEKEHHHHPVVSFREHMTHVVSTILIVVLTYVCTLIIPDVATVWSIFGSSMAIWIGFIVPCACYLKIREHKGITLRSVCGGVLLIISCIAAVVCTRQAFENAMAT